MKDLQHILREIQRLEATGESCVLATVVQVSGSAYRGPGTRMLITCDERTIGTISGGCLERDVVENALQVFAGGEPQVLKYDSTSKDDILWGTGLGCSGIVQVLLEKLPRARGLPYPQFLAGCVLGQKLGVLATVFEVEGSSSARLGQRLMLHQDFAVEDHVADTELREKILRDARRELDELKNSSATIVRGKTRRYDLAGGSAAVLLEPVRPLPGARACPRPTPCSWPGRKKPLKSYGSTAAARSWS